MCVVSRLTRIQLNHDGIIVSIYKLLASFTQGLNTEASTVRPGIEAIIYDSTMNGVWSLVTVNMEFYVYGVY